MTHIKHVSYINLTEFIGYSTGLMFEVCKQKQFEIGLSGTNLPCFDEQLVCEVNNTVLSSFVEISRDWISGEGSWDAIIV